MSLLGELAKYGKDLLLLNERVENLIAERRTLTDRLEDHERRLIRIELMLEFARTHRRALSRPE